MESNEKNELLEMINHEEDHQFNKKIERRMERKLTRKVICKITMGILIGCMLIGGCHFALNAYHYDPTKEDIHFSYILDAFVWTFYPGKMVRTWSIDEEGFGNYDIQLKVEEGYYKMIDAKELDTLKIRRSKINRGFSSIGLILTNEFDRVSFKNTLIDEKEKMIQDLEKLPESSYINASVVLKNITGLEEIIKMMNQYSNTRFVWLAMEQYDVRQNFITGMNLDQFMYGDSLVKYPHFWDMAKYENEEKTVEMLMTYYLEVLQVLVDHPQAYEVLNNRNINSKYENLLKQLEYSKEHPNCIGFRIVTNKDDLIDMLESGMVSYVWMKDVKLSVYSK